MAISKELLEYALAPNIWDYSNKILYDMCAENPRHTTPSIIVAKMNIIGRTYAAAIERRKNKEDTQGDFYCDYVVPTLRDSEIDDRIDSLKTFNRIERTNLARILGTHKYLVDLIFKIAGHNKRSLASKYLHFHLPEIFFLYDSQAEAGLKNLNFKSRVSRVAGDFDKEYNTFCLRLLNIREEIEREYGIILTPRQIDCMLLKAAQ